MLYVVGWLLVVDWLFDWLIGEYGGLVGDLGNGKLGR